MRMNRLYELEQYLAKKQYASIEELTSEFNISIQTLRRDLRTLQDRNVITKVYGGVLYNRENFSQRATPMASERLQMNTDAKEHIGQIAADAVEDNDIIFIDSGTTTLHMIPHLKDKLNLTIVTHCIDVARLASELRNVQIIGMGGRYINETRSFFSDTSTINYNYTKAFVSCIGISLPRGLTNENFFEAGIKQKAMNSSAKNYILADSSKFDCIAFNNFASFDKVSVVITNTCPSDKYTRFFSKNNIQYLY